MVNKKELIATTATKAGITKQDCEMVINAFIDAVVEAASTDDVNLGDIGKFKIAETKPTAERTMTSGLTGKEVVIPAKPAGKKATFKISKRIKDAVAGK